MIWPFKRKPKPKQLPTLLPDETWRPGDMAECVSDNWNPRCVHPPRKGAKALVLAVVEGTAFEGDARIAGLELLGFNNAWDARAFRKIVLIETGADRKVSKREPTDVLA